MVQHESSKDIAKKVNDYYVRSYTSVHGEGTCGSANKALHLALERRHNQVTFPATVELGAGNFEHLQYVRHDYNEYLCVDLRQPTTQVMKRLAPFPKAHFTKGDAQRVNLPDNFADRVVATCLLMHLPDPIQALREWQRICKPEGVVEFLVPTDPGFAIRLFRRFVSGREVKKVGLTLADYKIISAYDHLSSFHRLLEIARFCTEPNRKLSVEYFPFKWIPSFNANAFAVMRMLPRRGAGS